MPTPQFGTLGDNPTLNDVIDYIFSLHKELNYLLNTLDTNNVNRLDAKVIKVGTLDANLVTIRSDLTGTGSYLQIDTNGMVAMYNDPVLGLIKSFEIGADGHAYFRGDITSEATITGATIRSGATGTDRIELSNSKFRGINASEQITGLYFDITTTGVTDVQFYHNGTPLAEMYDNITAFELRGMSGASYLGIGASTVPTWFTGTLKFNGCTLQGLLDSTGNPCRTAP